MIFDHNMKFHFTGILFLVLHLSLNAQFGEVYKIEYPKRLILIDSIYTSFTINGLSNNEIHSNLNNLKELAHLKHDEITLWMYKVLDFRVKLYEDNSTIDQKVSSFLKLIYEINLAGQVLVESHALLYLAQILKENGRSGTSIRYMMRAYDLANNDVGNSVHLPQLIALRIANILYLLGDYNKAKEYALKSYSKKLKGHRKLLSYDLLSQVTLKLGQFDSSAVYINKCIEVYLREDTTKWPFKGWRGIILGYEGKIQFYKNDYERAIPLFKNALPILVDAGLYNNITSFAIRLAESYMKLEKSKEARTLLPLIETTVRHNTDDRNFLDYYKIRLLLDDNRQPVLKIYGLSDSILLYASKLMIQNDQNALIRHEMDFEFKYYKDKEEKLIRNIRRQSQIRTLLWSTLGLLVMVASIIFYLKHHQLKLQRKKAIKYQEETDKELSIAYERLNSFKNSLIEKSKKLENLETELNLTDNDLSMSNLRSKTILTEEEWHQFKKLFERVHGGYFTRLIKRFPTLSQGELRFFALIKLSLTNGEMASTLGVGPGAIRTMKSRLLKKLELEYSQTLEEIADQI